MGALVVGANGCGDDLFGASGRIDGSSPPAAGSTLVLWDLREPVPRGGYPVKLGGGTANETSFTVIVPEPFPEWIGNSGIGVGFVYLEPADVLVPDGLVAARG